MIAATGLGYCLNPMLKTPKGKKLKTIKGKHKALENIAEELKLQSGKPTVWFNATALGDFAIARPIIEQLKDDCNIVITFSSLDGYETMSGTGTRYENVFFLPWDSRRNAVKFIDLVKPSAAVFLESDLRLNFLEELKLRGIPAFLVSAAITPDNNMLARLGVNNQKDIGYFEKVYTLDDLSVEKFREMGISSVESVGNPLFDNAMTVAMEPYNNELVERFKGEKPLFIAGSIHMDDDMDVIERLVKEFTDIKFLIAPYDASPKTVAEIKKRLGLNIPSYKENEGATVLPPANALIIDYMGDLAHLYRYADFAYIGGGFTKSLHSVIEPAAYGLPVAFGPNTEKKPIAQLMEEKGVGEKFTTYPQLRIWLSSLYTEPQRRAYLKVKIGEMFEENQGAAKKIAHDIYKAAKRGPKPKPKPQTA